MIAAASKARQTLGCVMGAIAIAVGLLLLTPEWRSLVVPFLRTPQQQFFLGLVGLVITIGFTLSVVGGYVIAATAVEPTFRRTFLVTSIALIISLVPMLCYDKASINIATARTIIISLGTLLGGYLRTPQRNLQQVTTPLPAREQRRHLEKRTATSHEYARHMINNLVSWYSFFVTVNYASMGWFASKKGPPNGDLVVWISAFFIFQNVLGILACARIRRYILAVGSEIIDYEQRLVGTEFSADTRDVVIPTAVFARAIQLMALGLVSIVIMWIAFAALVSGSVQPDFLKRLLVHSSNQQEAYPLPPGPCRSPALRPPLA